MILISEFLRALEQVVPLSAVGYDKDAVGLQVGLDLAAKLKRALFAYEVTPEVIQEAKEVGANLIVAFHPLIFPSLNAVTESTRTGRLVRELVRNDIALYVQHTAFDSHTEFGTSQLMADVLELDNVRPLAPLKNTLNKITVFAPYAATKTLMEALVSAGAGRIGDAEGCSFQIEGRGMFKSQEVREIPGEPAILEGVDEVRLEIVCERWNTAKAVNAMLAAHPGNNVTYDVTSVSTESRNYGMGAVGAWPEALSQADALERIRTAFGTPVLRHSVSGKESIRTVALLGGSGMEFYSAARGAGADAFVTADIRYHDFYRAEHDGMLLIDAGHAETERFVTRGMARAARKALDVVNLQSGPGASLGLAAADSAEWSLEDLVVVARTEPNSVRYYNPS